MSILAFSARTYDELTDVVRVAHAADLDGHQASFARPPFHPHRLAVVSGDRGDLAAGLRRAADTLDATPPAGGVWSRGPLHYGHVDPRVGRAPTIGLFPGYGARPSTLTRDLMRALPAVGRWLEAFGDRFGGSPARSRPRGGASRRPVDHVLAADLAMWVCLRHAGVAFDAVAGHSFGENAALIASGVVDDVEAIVRLLGRLDAALAPEAPGAVSPVAMLALTSASRHIIDPWLAADPPRVCIALDNCPGQLVVCGAPEDLSAIERAVRDLGQVAFRLGDLERPVHTPQFPLSIDELRQLYASMELSPPAVPVWSASTAARFPEEPASARDLLARQWRSPVRFRELTERLYLEGFRTFVEIGPGDRLSGFVRDTLRGRPGSAAIVTHADGHGTFARLEVALAQLFVRGHDVDFSAVRVDRPSAASARASDPGARPAVQAGETATADMIAIVAAEVSVLLDIPAGDIDLNRGFFDLGLESMSCVALAERLREVLGRDVPQTLPFDQPTVRRLAGALDARQRGDLAVGHRPRRLPEQGDIADIAIVGMACRFPGGADTPDKYWTLLRDGVDAVAGVPADRHSLDALRTIRDADVRARSAFGAFLQSDLRAFDAAFFGISPREAVTLDPQQRLLLEVAWEALEHASIDPLGLGEARAGVFVGISNADYAARFSVRERLDIDGYIGLGSAASTAAGRISFALGLHGPCLALDTACSSSLAAVHLACESLTAGESAIALAGGVNLLINPETTILLSRAQALSPTGRCRTFDEAADGYVRGEGAGMVVLKRLEDARADGDHVLAVIRGTAMAHDGRTSGMTVPNGAAQEIVLRDALARARCSPGDIGYVEAHGTGTPLGDPIELNALARVFGSADSRPERAALGSVKTNIGHLEAAAGIASLIKTVLQIQHRWLAPSLHFRTPNPRVAWSDLPFEVASDGRAWPASSAAAAGVSSFGISGTNVHAIVAPPPGPAPASDEAVTDGALLVLSAPTSSAMHQVAGRLADDLAARPQPLADLSRTLAMGRAHFSQRRAIVVRDVEEAVDRLRAVAESGDAPAVHGAAPRDPRICLVFPDLPDVADELGWSADALFAFEIDLAALWRRWGIAPAGVAGHGVGARAAARVAGPSRIPIVSTGERFDAAAAAAIAREGYDVALEIGPGAVLTRLAARAMPASNTRWLPSYRSAGQPREDLLRTAGDLYECGASIRWEAVLGAVRGPRAQLPTYPFQREIYWIDHPDLPDDGRPPRSTEWPLRGRRVTQPSDEARLRFESRLSRAMVGDLFGSSGKGPKRLPISALLTMAIAAVREQDREARPTLDQFRCEAPVTLSLGPLGMQTVLAESDREVHAIFSTPDGTTWTRHATWQRITGGAGVRRARAAGEPDEIAIGRAEFYARARKAGADFGAAFEVVESVRLARTRLDAVVRLPAGDTDESRLLVLFECCLQLLRTAAAGAGVLGELDVAAIERLACDPHLPEHVQVTIEWTAAQAGLDADLNVVDVDGRSVAELTGVSARLATTGAASSASVRDRLTGADADAQDAVVAEYLHSAAGAILGLRGDRRVDDRTPLSRQGLDSLMALQLSTAIARELDVRIGVAQIVDNSIEGLQRDIRDALTGGRAPVLQAPTVASVRAPGVHGEL